jgi:VWFA-related protein
MGGRHRTSWARPLPLAILLPVCFLVVPSFQDFPALTAQEASFHTTSSELVVLPVVVMDRPDHYVSDLSADQFAVYDRPVEVQFFSSEDTPVTAGLIIDASSSMRRRVGDVVAAATAFANASNPDDELFAMFFNDEVYDAIADRRFVPAADLDGLNRALLALNPQGRTSLYDALVAGLDRLALGSRPRKVLLLISDGGDNASAASRNRVLDGARRSNAAIYTIGLFDDFDPDRNPGLLKTLAESTGGERYLPRSAGPLLQACQHIAREIRSGYTIGYVPPDRDGAFHRVRVEVKPRDGRKYNVRTRPGYFASRASAW